MVRDREAYAALIEDLDLAISHVGGQFDRNRAMTQRVGTDGVPDEVDVIALGYTIHNYYNASENYFLRIAKYFENNLDMATWHRDLVNRMSVAVEGLRPSLLPRQALPHFHELRAFRHVSRSLYDTPLDPEKVALANRHVPPAHEALQQGHLDFQETMRAIRDAL